MTLIRLVAMEQQQRQQSSMRRNSRYEQVSKSRASTSCTTSSLSSKSFVSKEGMLRLEESPTRSSNRNPVEWLHVTHNCHDDEDNNEDFEALSYAADDDDESNHWNSEKSWQEEAHWMSFRHAVQQLVASHQISKFHNNNNNKNNESKGTHDDDLLDRRSVCHCQTVDNRGCDDDSGVLVGVPHHVLLLTSPLLDSTFASNTTSSSIQMLDDSCSSLASDLAETKMRLALAQAERDELKFTLFLYQQQQLG